MLPDLDRARLEAFDVRRLEGVVDGLAVVGGRPLAVETTLEYILYCDGSPLRRVADTDGVGIQTACRRKSAHIQSWLDCATVVVWAVDGQWWPVPSDTQSCLSQIANGRVEKKLSSCAEEHKRRGGLSLRPRFHGSRVDPRPWLG